MASSGNTWFKKLRTKKRKFELRHTKARWAVDAGNSPTVKKVTEYLAPTNVFYVPCKPRGRSHVRLSHEKRLLILERHEKRVAFFAELGVQV